MRKLGILNQLRALLSIFFIGVTALFIIHNIFLNLIDKLDYKITNYESKNIIGKTIVDDLYEVKSDFYELVLTTSNKRSRKIIIDKINYKIDDIKIAINILEHGGDFIRITKSYDKKYDNNKKITHYDNTEDSTPLEILDLKAKLNTISGLINRANILLRDRSKFKKQKDNTRYVKISKEIKRFYKTIPAFFIRRIENIKRVLYENKIELDSIYKQIQAEKEFYTNLELLLIFFVISMVMFIGYKISNSITYNNNQMEKQKDFIKDILDAQQDIVIVSDGKEIVEANESLFRLFSEYKALDEFKKEHGCICDFFVNDYDENYIIKKDYDGKNWAEYVHSNDNLIHKTSIFKNDILYHFKLKIKKIVTKSGFTLVIVLSDITTEIEALQALEYQKKSLQRTVEEKTAQLVNLNEELEIKVVEELNKNREKDKQLIQQSRSAAMGEMIGNIAHQWRQPLSAISSISSGTKLQIELELSSNQEIIKSYDDIMNHVSYLTQTIEDFRNFFKDDKEKVRFDIVNTIDNTLKLTSGVYANNNIKVIENLELKEACSWGLPNELSQVLINVFNNAKDVFVEKDMRDRYVKISLEEIGNDIQIKIQDNAGGIPDNVIEKIFDPYFTTKHQTQGTGIGLYMSKEIIQKSFNGTLEAQNQSAIFDDIEYIGACFIVTLPKHIT